jgi:hypothetical protein
MRRFYTSVSSAFFLFALSATLLFGQRNFGTITGTVTDPTGADVPNAQVTITNTGTGVTTSTTSTSAGTFSMPALPSGTYTVSATAEGFKKGQQTGIVVVPGSTLTVNIPLELGASTTTVEVTSQAPLLQTQSTAVGTNLNSTAVTQLPLGGQRTFTYLARLSPAVVPAEPGARDAASGGFSANGVRSTGENNYLLNGIDNNVNDIDFLNQTAFVVGPAPDAIGNMQVITNGASAQYGRAAGGVLEVDLKSGTNNVHGTLFEFLQNTDLNANSWENNLTGTPRNPLKQNQFGGSIGFPIVKNKLFMFGDYQGTRLRTAGGTVSNLGYGGFFTIPTVAMRGGDFSRLLGSSSGTVNGTNVLENEIFDPTQTSCLSGCTPGTLVPIAGASPVYSRVPFANNQIPVTMMDPAAMAAVSYMPNPNQPIAVGTYPNKDYYTVTPGDLTTDQGDGRVDYHMNDSNSIFGSISWSDTSKSSQQPLPGPIDGAGFYGVGETDLGRDAQVGWTHIFSPTIVNDLHAGFSRLVTTRVQPNADTNWFQKLGIGGYDPTNAAALNGGPPRIVLGRYTGNNPNWLPTQEYSNEWDFIENLSIVKGDHSLKMGFEFRPLHFPFFQVPYPHGELTFARNETNYPSNATDSTGNSFDSDTGDEMASFLLGAINAGQISTTNFISSTKQAYAGYFEDTWKTTNKLTLTLGVRYELFSPIGEQFARQSNFVLQNMTLYIPKGPNQDAPLPPNFNTDYTTGGFTYPAKFPDIKVSRGQVSPYLIPWDKTDIGPRLGFAYNIVPKTVIRGFFGIFYGGEEQQGGNPNRGESVPFNSSPQLNRPAGVNSAQPDPFFAGGNPTGGLTAGFPTTVFTTFPVSSLQMRELAPNFRNPMVQSWNFTVQQQLPSEMALSVGYSGNHQAHQLLQPDFNHCPLIFTTNQALTCDALRIAPDIGSISGTATYGIGNYNALTAQLVKRMSNGLQMQLAYTYGHSLANSGTTLAGSAGLYTPDPNVQQTAYSSSSWDIRHNFTAAVVYEIPFGRGKPYGASMNRVVQTLLGNWQINAILTLRTGVPYTLRSSGCHAIGNGGCSPDFIGSGTNYNAAPSGGRTPSEWFDTSMYGPPSEGTLGNAGLQSMTGPPQHNLDFSIFKDFVFTERYKLEFRAESFNLTNTPYFTTPGNTLQNADFGQISGTYAGTNRNLQFALKLLF